MNDETELSDILKYCSIHLTWLGVWPRANISNKISYALLTFIILYVFSIMLLPQSIKLIKVWGNLDDMCSIISTAGLPEIVAMTKMFAVFFNKEKIAALYNYMVDHWEKQKSTEEMNIMIDYCKRGRNFSLLCVSSGCLTTFVHFVQCIFLHLKECNYSRICNNHTLCFLVQLPYDYHYSPCYEITVITHYVAIIFPAIAYGAIDGFFSIVVLFTSGQYQILNTKLLNLINNTGESKPWTEFNKQFGSIVDYHVHINSCLDILESIFYLSFLLQLLACTIQFCFQGYILVMIVTDKNSESMLLDISYILTYFIFILGNFFVYCYVAEILQTEHFMFVKTAYDCEWYKLPPEKSKLLIFLIGTGLKPLQITAGKFYVLNYSLFASIIKTSLGYLSFLITMKQTSNSN